MNKKNSLKYSEDDYDTESTSDSSNMDYCYWESDSQFLRQTSDVELLIPCPSRTTSRTESDSVDNNPAPSSSSDFMDVEINVDRRINVHDSSDELSDDCETNVYNRHKFSEYCPKVPLCSWNDVYSGNSSSPNSYAIGYGDNSNMAIESHSTSFGRIRPNYLKLALWAEIQKALICADETSSFEEERSVKFSFIHMKICEKLPTRLRERATVPACFLELLNLATEKNLRLENDDQGDITITKFYE